MRSASLPDEQAALLRAIVAHAEDDTPRLVYADWLDEQGDAEQAGFIRDSIKLAAMEKGAERREALAERLQGLMCEHRGEWYAALGTCEEVRINRFHRGFPYRVTFEDPPSFFAAADVLFAFVPVRGLRILSEGGTEFDDDTLVRFAAVPGLARITDLRLYDHHAAIAPEAWSELFRSPYLAGLTRLELPGCGIYELEATELADAAPLANLTELDLSFNGIGVDGARALFDSPHLTKLKALWLDHNLFGDEEGEAEVLGAWEERLGDGLCVYGVPGDDEEETV